MNAVHVNAPTALARTPTGDSIAIATLPETDAAYFRIDQADEIRKYYAENGYVVVRGLIPAAEQLWTESVRKACYPLLDQLWCVRQRLVFSLDEKATGLEVAHHGSHSSESNTGSAG